MKLPAAQTTAINDKLKAEINPLDLAPIRIQRFKHYYENLNAFAQIGENKMLLLSAKSELEMFAEVVPIYSTLKC